MRDLINIVRAFLEMMWYPIDLHIGAKDRFLSQHRSVGEAKGMSEQEKRQRRPAIGYTRTSSAANIGEGKDSVQRQRKAIQA